MGHGEILFVTMHFDSDDSQKQALRPVQQIFPMILYPTPNIELKEFVLFFAKNVLELEILLLTSLTAFSQGKAVNM